MYSVIKRFAESASDNGLILIDMPTGSGKTYNAIKYMCDCCCSDKDVDRKYIFVTTLKKNLPKEDLKKLFKEIGKEDLYEKKVLFIDSNMDCVVEGWDDSFKKDIPPAIAKTDEFKRFIKDLKFVKAQRKSKSKELKEFLPSIESNLREKSEPAFRNVLTNYINKLYPEADVRKYKLKTDKNWRWVGELYPALYTDDKQILFISMDKFLARNTTIIESSYMFYNSKLIENAVIFIDEFDATKETMQKKIIENGLHDRIDYIDLFKDIHAALHIDSFPTILTAPSKARLNGKYRDKSLDEIIKDVKGKSERIFENYSMQFKHRTTEDTDDTYQNYLFQDHQYHSILNDNNKYITLKTNSNKRLNDISFTKTKPGNEKYNIHVLLGQLRGFINYFQGAVKILAINYCQRKNENKQEDEETYTLEKAISSVLNLFRFNHEDISYLTAQIMVSQHKVKDDKDLSAYDLSFYENGFRYYMFENDPSHDMQSKIMMYSFHNTPEKILLRICERAKVIGISATATVTSVVGNYDIDYLKDKLQSDFSSLTNKEHERLASEFESNNKGYKDINIHAELLGNKGTYTDSSWKTVFCNEEIAGMIASDLRKKFSENEDRNDFNKERYLRIALAYKQFITHDDIYSFLCVLTKHPKKGDKFLDRDFLESVFQWIAQEQNPQFNAKRSIFYLDGAEYEDKKDELVNRLSKGEKIFVISVYQTIGAGQNIQYRIPEGQESKLVRINDNKLKGEKDFDAIYLDKPSNLIVNLTDNLEESEFIKYLFQMEFLQESAELSADDTIKNIKNAFKTYVYGKRTFDSYSNVYSKQSVVKMCTRYIIQAIGRICRTNMKSRNIYIYADNRITDYIDISVADNRVFNQEFMKLLEIVRQAGVKTPEIASLEDAASLKSCRVKKDIDNMLNNDWEEHSVDKWKNLRDELLRHPSASNDEADHNFIIKSYFAKLLTKGNTLYYHQESDFNSVSVSFTKDLDHECTVSEEGSKLPDMLRIPGVREMFEQNGWACSFKENDYLMTPPLYNNIYKGALGEVVGRYIFQKVYGITLDEIDDYELFEVFDFKVHGSSVYVDFKNWHENETTDLRSMLKKVLDKARKCNCKCVIIANLITKRNWPIKDVTMEGVRIVSIPALVLDDNETPSYIKEAWAIITECVDEYKDQD